ncbi:MAG: hypothetical protein WCI05_10465 [Myxococcales bacterium]
MPKVYPPRSGAATTTDVLIFHSMARWALLVALLVAVFRAARGVWGGHSYVRSDAVTAFVVVALADLQFVLGFVLYFWLSDTVRGARVSFAAAMRDRTLRFWAVEHLCLMVGAVLFVHVGGVLARRTADTMRRHRRSLWCFGLALLLVVVGIPWPFLGHGRPWLRVGQTAPSLLGGDIVVG